MAHGSFIVLEGIDGSGKGTQFGLLADSLRRDGHDVVTLDFPQYDAGSSYFVQRYLNGEYGTANTVGAYTASLFYALDRYDVAADIRRALDEGKVVLANRFAGSSMAHQGSKFTEAEQRRGFFIWLDNLEFETLKIPRPDLSIVLRLPAETAHELIGQKDKRDYTDKTHDLHEADLEHLRRSVETYDDLCQLFPKDFVSIDCLRNGKLMAIADIHRLLTEKIRPLLPAPARRQGVEPKDAVTTDTVTKTVAMAATSRGTSKGTSADSEKPAGNDRHQDNNRSADQKSPPQSSYTVPDSLDQAAADSFRRSMDDLIDHYETIVRSLTGYYRQQSAAASGERGKAWKQATRAQAQVKAGLVLPVAASPLAAAILNRSSRQAIREQVGGILPAAHAVTDNAGDAGKIILTDVQPRNELDIVADIAYHYADVPLSDVRLAVDRLDYGRKAMILTAYAAQTDIASDGNILDEVRYEWDILSETADLAALYEQLPASCFDWQLLTPRHGYDTPAVIEDAGLADAYDKCFNLSLEAYSRLQQAGYAAEAQSAVLQGHRLRWRFSHSPRQFRDLRGKPLGLIAKLEARLRETHPLLMETPVSNDVSTAARK